MAIDSNNLRLIPKLLSVKPLAAALLLAIGGAFALISESRADQVIGHNAKGLQYKVAKGDNLIGIAERITGSSSNWRAIAKANALAKPNVIASNQVLTVPFGLVPSKDAAAVLLSQSGQVDIKPSAGSASTSALNSGSIITTGASGKVALKLPDGTQMQIEPGSTVVLDRLKQYYLPSAVEARIQLEKGALEVASPGKRSLPLDVRTPRSTAAVRGTQFRVGTDNGNDRAEVLRGEVNYQSPAPAVNLARLTGAALPRDADKPRVENLLPAPLFVAPHVSTTAVSADLSWQVAPGPQPAAYKVLVTKDSAEGDIVSSSTHAQALINFASLDDGDYVLRVRPISAVGIEGQEAFQKVTFNARPIAPRFTAVQNDGLLATEAVRLNWEAQPEAVVVQLSEDKDFSSLLLEERVNGASFAVPSNLRGKRFYFRLASERAQPLKRGPFGNTYLISW